VDCYVTDAFGKRFLDFTSGYFVNQAGHCNPKVMAAAKAQLDKVTQVSGRHSTPAVVELAEKVVTRSPASLTKAFFTTGGSESVEFALKMARQHSGKTHLAVLDNAYHGLTLGVLPACAAEKYRKTAGLPLPLDEITYRLPTPYCYRCPHQQNCETQCLDEAEAILDSRPETAAFLAEPIQSVGGIIPPEKWWARADEIRKKRNLLLILDEIQTGVGRTGKMFAAEHYGLEPEILTGGKGLSGGVGSLGMVLCSDAVGEGFYAGTTPTSGGNAVSAAAGAALIDTLIEDGIIEHCAKMGEYFTKSVWDLADPWVGDVRFKGLMGGVELVLDRDSKEILPKPQVVAVKDALHERGMLITASGPHGNVLRLQPPLTITAKQLDSFTAELKTVLEAVRSAG
jgi:4-aminobutyrate aminotransferase-like enzyme